MINVLAILAAQNASEQLASNAQFEVLQGQQDILAGNAANVLQCIDAMRQSNVCHFYSDGAWSMHQLLVALLELSGPCKLYISSFAMSETAVRTLHSLKDAGLVKKLHCVIDNRVETRSAGSLQLLRGISDRLALRACHAKITILEGEHCQMLVSGSANYTENKRMEVGYIERGDAASNFHKQWILKILQENG